MNSKRCEDHRRLCRVQPLRAGYSAVSASVEETRRSRPAAQTAFRGIRLPFLSFKNFGIMITIFNQMFSKSCLGTYSFSSCNFKTNMKKKSVK
jgi:hypothetical protein